MRSHELTTGRTFGIVLLRQYFPKGSDLSVHSGPDAVTLIQHVATELTG